MWTCKLDQLMRENNVTQRELTDATGISGSSISRMRNNLLVRIDITALNTLAEYFEIKDGTKLFELVVKD